jgi:hypothetical protein
MARSLEIGLPGAGLLLGIAALALWVSSLPVTSLDPITVLMLLIAIGCSLGGYLRGTSARARRLGVVGIGWSALVLIVLAIVYAAG